MKQSLPHLSTLAAVIVTAAALAQPAPAPPPTTASSGEPEASAPRVITSPVPQSPPALPAASADQLPANSPTQPAAKQPISSQGAADQSALGDRLILQIANQLDRRASVTAKIRHSVLIGGEQLFGVGGYWQQGNGEDLKVRLELQIAGQEAQLLQVCNSRFMWIDRKLPTGRNVTRTDLRQLRADPTLSSPNLNDIKPGEASWSSLQSELTPYTGGMPRLLAALAYNFTFMPPQAMRLAIEPPLAAEPTSLPVFAIVGHWKPETLALILGRPVPNSPEAATQQPEGDHKKSKPVPERVPEEVLILVGQSDFFPYRIEYRHLETPNIVTGDGAPIPYQLSTHPMVVLEFSDVVFDSQITPGLFDYAPGNADWIDQTTVIQDRLRHLRQAQVATRQSTDSTQPANR